MTGKERGTGNRKKGTGSCSHMDTGTRYLFTPKMGEKVIAVTYCKRCGKELKRESVSVKEDT